jgi:type II secretory ATPase GspE/PulE/Tfp pilus assembly ATPase PilB-like protein
MEPEEIKKYGVDANNLVFYKGKGCDQCGDKGYRGRVAIYEVIGMDDRFEAMISEKGNNKSELEKIAIDRGMVTLKQDGLMKALLGLTTLEEVERVTEGSFAIESSEEEVDEMKKTASTQDETGNKTESHTDNESPDIV